MTVVPDTSNRGPPRRGTALSRALARGAMRLAGWRVRGTLPQEPRFVAILAPHTSNWDFLIGIAAMFALGFRLKWLGKHTIFRGPAAPLLRWLGGEPVDRTVAGGIVAIAIKRFATHPQYALGLSPEGTRQRVSEWRTGFHRIARGARIPIVPVVLDYQRRTLTIGAPFWPGSDIEDDLASLRALYRKEMAKHPGQFAEPAETSHA